MLFNVAFIFQLYSALLLLCFLLLFFVFFNFLQNIWLNANVHDARLHLDDLNICLLLLILRAILVPLRAGLGPVILSWR